MTMKTYRIFADGALIARNVLAATRFGQRLRGLLRRRELDRGDGLLLTPGGSVHTLGMAFPIDVVFLDRRNVVLDTRSNIAPNRACIAPGHTHCTLELWSGACSELDLRPGLQLNFVDNYNG